MEGVWASVIWQTCSQSRLLEDEILPCNIATLPNSQYLLVIVHQLLLLIFNVHATTKLCRKAHTLTEHYLVHWHLDSRRVNIMHTDMT